MFIKNQEIEIISEVLEVNGWLHRTVCLCLPIGNGVVCTREYPPGSITDQFGQYLMPKCKKITCVESNQVCSFHVLQNESQVY